AGVELGQLVAEADAHRRQREAGDADEEHALVPEQVAQLARGDQEHREGQQVAAGHPLSSARVAPRSAWMTGLAMPTTVPSSITMMTPRLTESSTSHGFPRAPVLSGGDDGAATVFASAMNPDRKSTRLNSSHVKISYAVVCLK